MDPIVFDRKPYVISYTDHKGEKQTIRRVPPPKLHEALPTDKVEILTKHSDDFDRGDVVKVKNINPRHPNTLQVETSDGKTAFLNYRDILLDEMIAPRKGVEVRDLPEQTKYLNWP